MLVPLSTVAYALGTASFPLLAQLHSEGKTEQLNHILNATLRGLIVFLVPISALGIVLREPIIYFVFSHTRLHVTDFQATAAALALFCIRFAAAGCKACSLVGSMPCATRLLPRLSARLPLLMFPLYGYCARRWDYLGLAAASSFGVTAYAGVLFTVLSVRTRNRNVGEFFPVSPEWSLRRCSQLRFVPGSLCGSAEFFPDADSRGARLPFCCS